MDPLDFLEDLLGDVAVRDVALLGGAELDEVVDLPQVPGEQDHRSGTVKRVLASKGSPAPRFW